MQTISSTPPQTLGTIELTGIPSHVKGNTPKEQTLNNNGTLGPIEPLEVTKPLAVGDVRLIATKSKLMQLDDTEKQLLFFQMRSGNRASRRAAMKRFRKLGITVLVGMPPVAGGEAATKEPDDAPTGVAPEVTTEP